MLDPISPTADLYLRPTAFVDAPFGLDGQVARLAGGMLWFSAIELIALEGGRRGAAPLVPVADIEDLFAAVSERQAERLRGIWSRIIAPRAPLAIGQRAIRLDQPQAMAILNPTPDSFSDGGRLGDDPAAIAEAGMRMAEAGAAILDVGGESTRPGAKPVWEGDEIQRIVPAIERLARGGAAVSVDTRKAAVMEAALAAGAGMVNDVSALTWDARAAEVVARAGCPVVLMHHQGSPETMQKEPRYGDVLTEVYDWLEARVEAAVAAGIDRSRILVDPGIGFGKTLRHNLVLLNGVSLLHGLGCGIVLGASRKRIVGALSNEAPVEARLGGSLALALAGVGQGVQLVRVHDAFETAQALRVWRGMRDVALSPVG